VKIGIVHSYYSNAHKSGENNVVDAQIELFLHEGHELRVFTTSSFEKIRQPFYRFSAGINVIVGSGDDPQPIFDDFKPDIILAHNLFPNIGTGWLRKFGSITYSFNKTNRRNSFICVIFIQYKIIFFGK
jgi:hypothetical protein